MSENVHDEAADESVPGDAPVADTGAALSVPVSSKRWYVVHAYSGMEKSVMRALTERIERAGMQDQFGQILVPIEEVVEVKNGVKSVTERRCYPGYVLVEMEMTDESWHLQLDKTNDFLCHDGSYLGLSSSAPPILPWRGSSDRISQ